MASFLTIFGAVLWMLSLANCAGASNALQQIAGLILFLTGSIFMCTGIIVQQIRKLQGAAESAVNEPKAIQRPR